MISAADGDGGVFSGIDLLCQGRDVDVEDMDPIVPGETRAKDLTEDQIVNVKEERSRVVEPVDEPQTGTESPSPAETDDPSVPAGPPVAPVQQQALMPSDETVVGSPPPASA